MSPPKDEAEYLARQAAEARAAMRQTARELGSSLTENIQVAKWTERHPWVVTGAAAAIGVVAAQLLFGGGNGRDRAPRSPTPARPSLVDSVLDALVEVFKSLIAGPVVSDFFHPDPPPPDRPARPAAG